MFLKKLALALLAFSASLSLSTIQAQDPLKKKKPNVKKPASLVFDSEIIKMRFIYPESKKLNSLSSKYKPTTLISKTEAILYCGKCGSKLYYPLNYNSKLNAWYMKIDQCTYLTSTYIKNIYTTIPKGYKKQKEPKYYKNFFKKFTFINNNENELFEAKLKYCRYEKGSSYVWVLNKISKVDLQ